MLGEGMTKMSFFSPPFYFAPTPLHKLQFAIVPRARVGCEIIDSQRGALRRVGSNHLTSNRREWNNCFTKTPQRY